MGKLEKQIQADIKAALESIGCLVLQMNMGAIIVGGRRVKNPLKGFPDLWGWLPNGRGFAIEIKRPDAKPQDHEDKQEEWRVLLLKFNVLAFKCDNVAEALENIKPAMSECFT